MQSGDEFQVGVKMACLRFRLGLWQFVGRVVRDDTILSVVPGRIERWNLACETQVLHKLTGSSGPCSAEHFYSSFLLAQLSVVPLQLALVGICKKESLWDQELFSRHVHSAWQLQISIRSHVSFNLVPRSTCGLARGTFP